MTSSVDDSSLLLNQDTNQFFVQTRFESKISNSTIRDFTSWVNWNPLTKIILLYYSCKDDLSNNNQTVSRISIRGMLF